MLLRILMLMLVLAGTTGAQAAHCVPGTPACCPDNMAGVVPSTRGMGLSRARAALLKEGFVNIGRLGRPTDGMQAGRVMGSNPHVGVQVCLQTRVVLYHVTPGPPQPPTPGSEPEPGPRHRLRNFSGDSVDKARIELQRQGLDGRMSFASCGASVDVGDARSWNELIVTAQRPPEGTPIDSSLQAGMLYLVPYERFWRSLEGLTRAEASARVAMYLGHAGWHISPSNGADNAGAALASADAKVVAALPDALSCSITLLSANDRPPLPPPPPEPPTSASPAAPEAPAEPASPAAPLAAGAIGGALLARMLWPRDREAAAAVVSSPDVDDGLPRLRVRRDQG